VTRLSRATLPHLPPSVRRPVRAPTSITTGIAHLGLGAFARAHLAAYTEPLLADDPSWGILGLSLRSPAIRDALAPQDFLYARAERDGASTRLAVMGALTGLLVVPENPLAAIARLTDPAVRIVTLTITEKGYCRHAATGELDAEHAGIRHDLETPDSPRTAPGLLVAALAARRNTGVPPFTLLSCDNLPRNGHATRQIVTAMAALRDTELAHFIADNVAFPDSMVDRIVPATTPSDRDEIAHLLGVTDAAPVLCEPFSQWVIEDHFPTGRPAWEATGATLVRDVRPYEDMKLRLLNASHSTIAYLGQLAGWETVADAIADATLRAHIAALMRESATTLRMPEDTDLAAYETSLLARFANPALRHRTAQIAMDGSQKLPQRLFAAARDRLATGQAAPRIAFSVAAWLRYLHGRNDHGQPLTIDDPLATRLVGASREAVFAMSDIVPPEVAASPSFTADVDAAFNLLEKGGTRAALSRML
jgi:fructuronate reductase